MQGIAQTWTNRVSHRDMGDEAFAKEALLTGECPIDELIDDDESPRIIGFSKRAHGGQRDHIGCPRPFENVDIGAVIDIGRGKFVPAPVARQEDDPNPVERTGVEGVRRRAPGGRHVNPLGLGQPFDLV